MPYKMTKGKGGYTVSSPHGVKGRNMTTKNAKSQVRLLQAIEHNPEFAKKIRVSKGRGGGVAKPRS